MYSAGRVDGYDLNDEYYTKYIRRFTRDEYLKDVKDICGGSYLYSVHENGDIVCSYGYSYKESDNDFWKLTPERLTDMDEIEMVYGAIDVAYFRKGLYIYIIKK